MMFIKEKFIKTLFRAVQVESGIGIKIFGFLFFDIVFKSIFESNHFTKDIVSTDGNSEKKETNIAIKNIFSHS